MKKQIIITILISTLLLFTGLIWSSNSQEETQPNRRIIDMHLHAIPVDHFPQHWDEWAGFDRPDNDAILMAETLDALERFGIVKGITSGHMEFLEEFRKAAPDRIIPSLMVGENELALPNFADSLEAWYEQGLFEVIGEVPTQYAGIAPSDPVMQASIWLRKRSITPKKSLLPAGLYFPTAASKDSERRRYRQLLYASWIRKHALWQPGKNGELYFLYLVTLLCLSRSVLSCGHISAKLPVFKPISERISFVLLP